ncbi:hypothetical protein BRD56_10900 [Thermoplasmatales archaeon SW_10_69_26]|nr:MAG: hypothetical protein BRD56_10900 [Thermoplasmatales archaeon SW_10_69_26]
MGGRARDARIWSLVGLGCVAAVVALGLAGAHVPPDPTQTETPSSLDAEADEPIAALLPGPLAAEKPALPVTQEAENLELVGHTPLEFRGSNTNVALSGDHAYVGFRADGTHEKAGVLVVDVSDPSDPTVVDRIGQPHQAEHGLSSPELRVWPDAGLLFVMNLKCEAVAHGCYNTEGASPTPDIEIYDVSGDNAADPEHVTTYVPRAQPHEFHLWIDPADPQRALLYQSMQGGEADIVVADVSEVPDGGDVVEIADWEPEEPIPHWLHSLSVHPDGQRAYLAHWEGGFLVLDTSEVAAGVLDPEMGLVTPVENRADWSGPGAHSALKVPGRDVVWTTDESFGEYAKIPTIAGFERLTVGCPWTWARAIDVTDPADPEVLSSFKTAENTEAFCESAEGPLASNTTTFSSHTPLVTEHLAVNSWFAGGLVVVDTTDPTAPEQVGNFRPRPIPAVTQEYPPGTQGPYKVAMWSYPVVQDGLIYVVDARNGLYVLDYQGPHSEEIDELGFLQSNSNRGDADRLYGVTAS